MTLAELEEVTMDRIYWDCCNYCGDEPIDSGFIDDFTDEEREILEWWEVSQIYCEHDELGKYLYVR